MKGNMWYGLFKEEMEEVNSRIGPSIRKSTVAHAKPKRDKTESNRQYGVIKMFNVEKGFGFIRTKGAEYFFHANNVEASDKSGVFYLMPRDQVTFEVGTDKRGRPAAVNVRMRS